MLARLVSSPLRGSVKWARVEELTETPDWTARLPGSLSPNTPTPFHTHTRTQTPASASLPPRPVRYVWRHMRSCDMLFTLRVSSGAADEWPARRCLASGVKCAADPTDRRSVKWSS
ncbi:unnamed protein product [Protopolystoma xenopodis]|uniref:Uncharacterized protein n=1 Tax=Protopolystoma xenopodis TaxID=117903 RepID=A0A448X892_9PLAT|nr:unnamed protein product [Protopolystoma xenopodis]